jgi:hypothetical protein
MAACARLVSAQARTAPGVLADERTDLAGLAGEAPAVETPTPPAG